MKSLMIYLVTRTHGLHTHLLTQESYNNLIKTRDSSFLMEYLLKSDYGTEVSKIPSRKINSSNLNPLFYSALMSRLYHLVKIAPNDVREFLMLYADRYEVENIKRILRSKRTKSQITQDILIPIPREYALINFQAMIEARSLQDSIELLKATRYSKIIEKLPVYQRYEVLTVLEALIDKIYYRELWTSLKKMPDHDKIEAIIGTEMDLKNICVMTDLRARDIDPETVLTSSFNSYRLREEDINLISKAKIDVIPDIVARTPYQRFALNLKAAINENKLETIEQIIYKEIFFKANSISREKPNSFAYVIGYLVAADVETRNLIALSTAKKLGLEEEKIRSLLYL